MFHALRSPPLAGLALFLALACGETVDSRPGSTTPGADATGDAAHSSTSRSSEEGGEAATTDASSSGAATSTSAIGMSSSTGDSGGSELVPSQGCGTADPERGALTIPVGDEEGDYIVSLPSDYDPSHPYALGFAFHGFGRTGPQCQTGDCAGFQAAMGNEAILVYMTTLATERGWEGNDERERNVAFFEAVLERMENEYCVDRSKIFAAGTSSGGHFANILGCRFGDRLLAIAPVAGYLPETENCVDSVAALVIHGYRDTHVEPASGEQARDFWRDRNNCDDSPAPSLDEVRSTVEATAETHACAEYPGCDPGHPVTWCEHSVGGYDDSTHGWPPFAGQAIWDFVQAL